MKFPKEINVKKVPLKLHSYLGVKEMQHQVKKALITDCITVILKNLFLLLQQTCRYSIDS